MIAARKPGTIQDVLVDIDFATSLLDASLLILGEFGHVAIHGILHHELLVVAEGEERKGW